MLRLPSCCHKLQSGCHKLWLLRTHEIRDSNDRLAGGWTQNGPSFLEVRHRVGNGFCMCCCCGLGSFFLLIGFGLMVYDAVEGDPSAAETFETVELEADGSWQGPVYPLGTTLCATNYDCELTGECLMRNITDDTDITTELLVCEYSRERVSRGVAVVIGFLFIALGCMIGGMRGGCKWQVYRP
jgi:hypothetical protein